MWAQRHFQTYLYGCKFVSRMDNHALEYLKSFMIITLMEMVIEVGRVWIWYWIYARKIHSAQGCIEYTYTSCVRRPPKLKAYTYTYTCHKIRGNDCLEGQYYLEKEGLIYKRTGNFLEDQLIIPHSLNQTASWQPICIPSGTAKNIAAAYFALFVATNEKNNSNLHS
jgi:hypothetical protein